MEDKEKDADVRKLKMKKKRKMEGDASYDYNVTKKKRKKKADKEEENEGITNTVYRKRKRKKSENDCIQRDESSSETSKLKTGSEKKEAIQDELTVNRKKKKKRIHEEKIKEYMISESPPPRKKSKKKKKKEKAKQRDTLDSSFECSFTQSPLLTEKGDERGERIGEVEDQHSLSQHIYLKSLPMQEKRQRNKDKQNSNVDQESKERRKKVSTGEETKEKSSSYKKKRRKEKKKGGGEGKEGKPKSLSKQTTLDEDENEEDRNFGITRKNASHPNRETSEEDGNEEQNRNASEKRKDETRETKPQGITSRLAYSGLHGWETDATVDDLDYSDDQYHQSPAAIRSRVMEERRRTTKKSNVLYSEGEEVEGFVPGPRYSSDNVGNGHVPVEVPSDERSSPGFVVKQREIPSLEEAIYKFPPGVGVSPEEVEEVNDAENYWIVKERNLQPSAYAEEAKECIDDKIEYIEDYFERLQAGQLDPKELKETKPDNFDEPFYPTPRQLEFLDTLSIRVDWPLSDLHQYHLHTLTLPNRTRAQWSGMGLFADTSRFALTEDKIIARNWFAFRKEYGFHDLRPLVSVRTARVMREGGQLVVQPYEYLSHTNRVRFLLYLAKDLPTRTLSHVNRRILKLLPFLRGRCLLRQSQRATGPLLAQLLYVMQLFGADMLAAELLVGRSLRSYYSRCFALHIMLRDIKLRVGPWREAEDERFLRGLKEVLHIRSYGQAYRLRRIPWMAIFPYVRTRSIKYMRRRLIVLASKEGEREHPSAMRELMAKFIRLLYNEQVEDFTHLAWEEMASQVGAANPIRLVWSFRKLYFNHIPYQHRNTVPDGLKYLYERILPFYERHNSCRIPQPDDPDFQEHHHTHHHPDPTNPSDDPIGDHLQSPVPDHDLPDFSSDDGSPSTVSDMLDDPESDLIRPDIEFSDLTNEPLNPRKDNRNSRGSNETLSESVDSGDPTKVRTTPGDLRKETIANDNKASHKNQRITNPSQGNKLKNTKKAGTSHLFDPARLSKVGSNLQDPRSLRKVDTVHQRDLYNLKKHLSKNTRTSSPSQQHHQLREDQLASSAVNQLDANTLDLFDDDNDDDIDDDDDDELLTSSDSDVDDFELETLSQAVQRNVSHGRKSK